MQIWAFLSTPDHGMTTLYRKLLVDIWCFATSFLAKHPTEYLICLNDLHDTNLQPAASKVTDWFSLLPPETPATWVQGGKGAGNKVAVACHACRVYGIKSCNKVCQAVVGARASVVKGLGEGWRRMLALNHHTMRFTEHHGSPMLNGTHLAQPNLFIERVPPHTATHKPFSDDRHYLLLLLVVVPNFFLSGQLYFPSECYCLLTALYIHWVFNPNPVIFPILLYNFYLPGGSFSLHHGTAALTQGIRKKWCRDMANNSSFRPLFFCGNEI